MGRNFKYLLLLIFIVILLPGCKRKDNKIKEEAIGEKINLEKDIEEKQVDTNKNKSRSPLSGIFVEENLLDRRVMGVMFDNHPRARWQAGLKDAEIVYEYEVEAPYTRYLGLFLSNDPETIGPIRSARPYFITTVLEHDALYVRVGGSGQAEEEIIKYNVDDIDARSSRSSIFWRKSHKKAPNNLYSDMTTLRDEAEEKDFNRKKNKKVFSFNRDDRDLDGFLANEIDITYNTTNNTYYSYNKEEKIYYRKKDGQEHIDEIDARPITSKNIIVREVEKNILKDGKKIELDLVGRGKGKYFTNGMGVDINWSKKSREERSIYTLENGQELRLNPGTTFVQVVSPKASITIK